MTFREISLGIEIAGRLEHGDVPDANLIGGRTGRAGLAADDQNHHRFTRRPAARRRSLSPRLPKASKPASRSPGFLAPRKRRCPIPPAADRKSAAKPGRARRVEKSHGPASRRRRGADFGNWLGRNRHTRDRRRDQGSGRSTRRGGAQRPRAWGCARAMPGTRSRIPR